MSSTQTAITIAASTSIATALLIYLLLRPRKKDDVIESELRRSDDGRKIQEDSLNRRRAAVLAKPLPELEDKRTDESDDQDENIYADVPRDHKKEAGHAIDNTNGAAKYSSKNLRYYQQSYDTDGIIFKEPEIPKNIYRGYSSHFPDSTSDQGVFPNNEVNVKRLGDWNKRFQSCIKKLNTFTLLTPLQERLAVNLDLMHLAQDFIYAATTYGKIIISEYYLPRAKKTIKPCSELPGLMGGQKYIVHNILFKFAVDYNGLFGNDYAAAKAAGNELRGLISYFNTGISDLNVPLMALVDYRGFRLIAMSILPVGEETIIYGSCDAGRNIHANDDEFNELMKVAAKKLNLKPHRCRVALRKNKPKTRMDSRTHLRGPSSESRHSSGDFRYGTSPARDTNSNTSPLPSPKGNYYNANGEKYDNALTSSQSSSDADVYETPMLARSYSSEDEFDEGTDFLYSPADLEGHKGRDGKFYLLDFSRVLPPETPNPHFKNSHLSRLLRPEFVQTYPKPLCPDAFSGFMKEDGEENLHNSELKEATNHLINVLVPKFAKADLVKLMADAREQGRLTEFRLTETIHSVGVNCRHIGLLRKNTQDPEFKRIMLIEMVARVIKNNLRFKLREKMKVLRLPLEEPYRRLVIDYFNLVFGNTKNSDSYWDDFLKKDLLINFPASLHTAEATKDHNLKPRIVDVKVSDVVDQKFMNCLFEKVRKMMALGFTNRQYNFNLEQPFDDTDLDAIGERVKHMNIMAHAQGFFYHMKGLINRVDDPLNAQKFYETAIGKFEEALDANPNNKEILLSIALTWMLCIEEETKLKPTHNEREKVLFSRTDPRVRKAEEYSLRAIAASPKYDSFSLFRYAQFLEKCGDLDTAEDYYLMALEADPNNAGCLHCYGNFLSERGLEEEAESFYLRSSKNTIGQKYMPEYYY
eukprot:TRINITY_DN3992_c0_g1_i1.p1 TRINITY_DN3992_c0_g1~~TRINITY_DN3992_c0_g1_i1.p1  ORF type:complete len:924 (-),score=198.60 TRINITY_DN3992_c0_g1_i1:32-2803(-)